MSDTNKERESVVIDFSQVGTAGPFPVVNGRVQVPDVTMLDLARMLKPTSDALAAPMPQSAGVTDEQIDAAAAPWLAPDDQANASDVRQIVRAVLALAPGLSGWQKEPTAAMVEAGYKEAEFQIEDGDITKDGVIHVYRAMVAAAPGLAPHQPQPEPTSKGVEDELRESVDSLRRALEIIAVGDSQDPVRDAGDELVALGYWSAEAVAQYRAAHTSPQPEPQEAAENQILRAENDSLRATLDRIAAMDKEGVRADDLGRAARTARDSLANCESLLSILADKSGVNPESVLCEVLAEVRAALSAPQEAGKAQVCGYPACGCNPKHCPLDESKEVGKVEAVADEPVAWQERQQTKDGWTDWYNVKAKTAMGKGPGFCEIIGGIKYQWRPLYLRPSQQASGEDAKDAARYRWLVNQPMPSVFHPAFVQLGHMWKSREGISSDIDAAILAAAGGSEK